MLKEYLEAIKEISPQDKEYTHRTALENLLNALKERLATTDKGLKTLAIKHEPNHKMIEIIF